MGISSSYLSDIEDWIKAGYDKAAAPIKWIWGLVSDLFWGALALFPKLLERCKKAKGKEEKDKLRKVLGVINQGTSTLLALLDCDKEADMKDLPNNDVCKELSNIVDSYQTVALGLA